MIGSLPAPLDVAVDLGSGPGRTVPALATRARTVLAVDVSAGMLGLRRHAHPAVLADGHSLPMRASSVDACCLRMSVHYFSLPALREQLRRVLKPAGWLLIVSIFPYGPADTAWFNERHRLKGKGGVHTPCVESLTRILRPGFEPHAASSWHAVHPVRSSMRSHPAAAGDELLRHALGAPAAVRKLYRIAADGHGDVTITVQWAALLFGRTP